MTGLIKRIFGLKRIEEPKREEYREDYSEPQEQKIPGEYSVPDLLQPDGFYAVKISQGEMYDLGNMDFIVHFILYDRKEKIAIDVTSDVQPAPLLSATIPADIITKEGVDTIEKYLTGEVKPEFDSYNSFGVSSFIARELSDVCYAPLRARMLEVRDTKMALDSATNAFRKQATNLRTKYFSF